MSLAAISIHSAASGAAARSTASRANGFDSVLSGVGHAPRDADRSASDDAGARAAARDDQDDSDREDIRRDRDRDAGEDPAALLAFASSVAAITRNDSAADKAATDETAPPAAVTTAAPTLLMTPADATVRPAQPASADMPAAAALSAALSATPPPPAAKPAKATRESMIDAATAATADILAARAAKVAPVAAAQGGGSDVADADDGDAKFSPDPTLAAATTAVAGPSATGSVTPSGGEVLATGGADRQLDLARGDAWLDGLARDIASTADAGGTLRFQLSPPALGSLHVELTRGDDGTAVKMTTATIDAQAILTDAKPRLIETARAHGVRISDASIDLGGAGTATGGGQQRDVSGGGGSSSNQPGALSADGGGANGQAQSRRQSEPDLYREARRPGTIASASNGGSRRDLDAGYA